MPSKRFVTNQRGFSLALVVLVIVLLMGLAVGGWYFYPKIKSAQNPNQKNEEAIETESR